MDNALHQPQIVVVLGGSSDIGLAIVRALASPALRAVVLAVRDPDRAPLPDDLPPSVTIDVVTFDATDHASAVSLLADIAARHGDIDVVVQAFGQLGTDIDGDPVAAARLVEVNTAGAVSSGLAAAQVLRTQGHGSIVVLSSVAGVRTRPSNFVYGATKAGQDAFATGLGHALRGTGVHVLTVRPGFVRSSMTAGLDAAPFSVDPSDVAAAVVDGLRRRRSVVWVPGILRLVFALLRLAPGPVWRRLDR